MRKPLVAALVAVAALSTPTHATTPGVGAVALAGTSFFRPAEGVAVAGACTYVGTVLAGVAVGVTVPPLANEYTSIECDLHDGAGLITGFEITSGGATAIGTQSNPLSGRTPSRICGRARAKLTTWSGVADSGYTCAAVLPGPN